MTYITNEQNPSLTIELTSPAKTQKKRSERQTLLEAHLTGTQHEPREYKVQAWITENYETRHGGYAVPLTHLENGVFQEETTFEETGIHSIKVRAKHRDDTYWTWQNGQSKPITEVHVDPSYVDESIVYNAFVRYFGARTVDDGTIKRIEPGTFDDLTQHIKKLKHMGVNVLYLNPVHLIGELYKNYNPNDALPNYLQPGCPYSVKDYRSIDPELSFGEKDTDSDKHPFSAFKTFVEEAHNQNIRVYMDLVFNHSAHDSVFQRMHPEWFLYKEGPWSIEQPYIYPEEIKDGKPWGDPKHTYSPYDHGHWWKDTAQLNWNNLHELPQDIFPHHRTQNQPPENPTIDAMYNYFINIVKFWIKEFGIDGFRCDVAYRIPRDFWRKCITEARETAKQAHPENGSVDGDVVFIAEDYHVNCQGLLEAGFAACYGDYSNKLGSLPDITGYLDYMLNISGDHFPENPTWFTFPECHDFHRNPTKIAKEYRRDHRDADLNANKSRWTMTATLPGIPMIFNGFEKIEWEAASLFSYSKIDWEADKDISEHIKQVNMVRNHEPALQTGSYHYVHTNEGIRPESKVFSFLRIHEDDVILVAVNIDVEHAAENVELYLPSQHVPKRCELKELITNQERTVKNGSLSVSLPPGEALILKLQ